MRTREMLTKLFKKSQLKIHGARINFLGDAIEAVLSGSKLSCTSLGRGFRTKTTTKHNIKRVNNMLGNRVLQRERASCYQALCFALIKPGTRPLIAVDWSSTNASLKNHILRATLITHKSGRGIVIYEEVHRQKKLANSKIEANFLKRLKHLLPTQSSPIIITDAGYQCPWFEAVLGLGWDYVGRVRGFIYYRIDQKTAWAAVKNLFKRAKHTAQYLDNFVLSKNTKLHCQAVLVKKRLLRRKKKTVTGKSDASGAARKNASRARDPWLLVTSLKPQASQESHAKKIVAIYQRRMQIEENFRDTKSIHYGMGLKAHRSRSEQRIQILLLIGALAHYFAYLIGMNAYEQGWQKQFQANTVTQYRILSFVFLGMAVWQAHKFQLNQIQPNPSIIKQLQFDDL